MNEHAKRNAVYTLVAGLVLTLYGWNAGLEGISDSAFYNATVDVFTWMLRCGGAALLVSAGLCFFGLRHGLLLDGIVSLLCGVVMTLCGLYWMKDGFLVQYALFVLFGVIFFKAGLNSLAFFRKRPESVSCCGSQPPAKCCEPPPPDA